MKSITFTFSIQFILFSFLLFSISFNQIHAKSNSNVENPTRMKIMQHWAPQVYQDTRNDYVTLIPFIWTKQYYEAKDFITKVNFDGDWSSLNQRESSNIPNQGYYPQFTAHAYSSFVETDTHYFLGYGFYHADDDAVLGSDRHQNDYEDVYMSIRKNNSKYGEFDMMVTNLHGKYIKFYKHDISFHGNHPKIYISSNGDVLNSVNLISIFHGSLDYGITGPFGLKGHGIVAYKPGIHDKYYVGNDAIVYNVSDIGEAPTSTDGRFRNSYNYSLIDINELWNRRFFLDATPYSVYSKFHEGGNTSFEEPYLIDPAHAFGISDSGNYIYNPFFNNSSENPYGNPTWGMHPKWNAKFIRKVNGENATLENVHYHNKTFIINVMNVKESKKGDIYDDLLFSYRKLKGNSLISARVYSIQEDIHPDSSAGLMVRNSLESTSKDILVKTNANKQIVLQYREADGSARKEIVGPKVNGLVSFKINRDLDVFNVYYKTSYINSWTILFSIDIDMQNEIYAGTVSYSNSDRFCSVIIDDIRTEELFTPEEVEHSNGTYINNKPESVLDVNVYSSRKLIYVSTNKVGELKNAKLSVYDLTGKRIYTTLLVDGHNRTINTGIIGNGPCIVKIVSSDGRVYTKKIFLKEY